MKRTYKVPSLEVERFVANEYISACWGVSCSVESSNTYEKGVYVGNGRERKSNYAAGQTHSVDHCGLERNQVIRDNNTGIPVSMTEIGTDGLGNLACTIFTDSNYNIGKAISTIKAGDYIYWTTSSGNRTWHHQGRVHQNDPKRPNHS